VLLVSSTLEDDGGVPVCVGQLAEALAGIGVPVGVVGQHAGPLAAVIDGAARRSGVEVEGVREPWHPLGQWRAAARVRTLVRQAATRARSEGRDLVVHLHGVWVAPVLAAGVVAVDVGATLVVSPHGMLRREALRKSPLRKRAVWDVCLRRLLIAADTPRSFQAVVRPSCRSGSFPLPTLHVRVRQGNPGGPDTSGGSFRSRISISFSAPGAPFGPRAGDCRSMAPVPPT
jgi:hypothetical protein